MSGVRKPAVCGTFYPSEKTALYEYVNLSLQNGVDFGKKPVIVVSPHAGYVYSGKSAGVAFKQLSNLDKTKKYKVLLAGPSHRVYLDNAALSPDDSFYTPLGEIEVDKDESTKLLEKFSYLSVCEAPHKLEHSLETQLPFLKLVLPNSTIVPLVYGAIEEERLSEIFEAFLDGDDKIIVISSDLSHYYPLKEANFIDSRCVAGVEKLSLEAMDGCEACGKPAINAAIRYAVKRGLKSKTLDYSTSAEAFGDASRVVGYGSFMFYKEQE